MKKVLLGLALALLGMVSWAVPQKDWVLLRTGVFHDGEAPRQPGHGWLVLRQTKGQWALVPTTVTSRRVRDEMMDDPESKHLSGVEISSRPRGDLLLRHAALRAGPVDSARIGGVLLGAAAGVSLTDGKPVRIEFKGQTYTLAPTGPSGPDGPEQSAVEYQALLLTGPQGTSALQKPFIRSENSTIVWAGDLNHDGKLDLVVDVSPHYNAQEYCLFLSSGPKGALQRAGCHGITGC